MERLKGMAMGAEWGWVSGLATVLGWACETGAARPAMMGEPSVLHLVGGWAEKLGAKLASSSADCSGLWKAATREEKKAQWWG